MTDRLKSPTCSDCARQAGLVPVTDVMTVYEDRCANCGEVWLLSTARDWKRPGEPRSLVEWD